MRTRNVGILAHVDAGKTTLTERILFATGAVHRTGEVHDGTTVTDFDAQERERGITIFSAAVTCTWNDHEITLIDTPGHVDFSVEVERSLRVLDGAVVVLDAVAGVEPQTEAVWRRAARWEVPVVVFVNKLDRPGASLDSATRSLRTILDVEPLVAQLPVGVRHEGRGAADRPADVRAAVLGFARQGQRAARCGGRAHRAGGPGAPGTGRPADRDRPGRGR